MDEIIEVCKFAMEKENRKRAMAELAFCLAIGVSVFLLVIL